MSTRRTFLLAGLGVVVVAGIGVIGVGRMSAQSHIVAAVRRRLPFLKLDEAGLQAFAHDQVSVLLAKRPTWNRIKYHYSSLFEKPLTRFVGSSTDRRDRWQRMDDNFASTFLLSSDFFVNGSDAAEVVRYVGFYDPLRPCGNPFWRPVEAGRPETGGAAT
jgi:hypothetical protein